MACQVMRPAELVLRPYAVATHEADNTVGQARVRARRPVELPRCLDTVHRLSAGRYLVKQHAGRRYDVATGLEQEVVPEAGPAVPTREGLLLNDRLVDDQLFSTNDDRTVAYRYDLRNPAGLVPIYTAAGRA
mgnify:CR=1 FL=1|jgi:hypothetical protein